MMMRVAALGGVVNVDAGVSGLIVKFTTTIRMMICQHFTVRKLRIDWNPAFSRNLLTKRTNLVIFHVHVAFAHQPDLGHRLAPLDADLALGGFRRRNKPASLRGPLFVARLDDRVI